MESDKKGKNKLGQEGRESVRGDVHRPSSRRVFVTIPSMPINVCPSKYV